MESIKIREGQCPSRRHPEAAPGARHTRERAGGPGGREQGRWGVVGEAGGSRGSPGSWLSRLPSAPPGKAVVRLRVAVVTLAGNRHLFCLETVVQRVLCECPGQAGRAGSLIRASLCGPRGRAPNPDLALVSPLQGATNMGGPLPPLAVLGPPIFPCSPSPQDPRAQAHVGHLVLTEAVRVTPAPPPDAEAGGPRGRQSPHLSCLGKGFPAQTPGCAEGLRSPDFPVLPHPPEGQTGKPVLPTGQGAAWC